MQLPDKRFERPAAALGQRHRRIAAGADHVVELAAGDGRQPQAGELLQRCGQYPSHEAVAAAASQMDVRTGVTAPQAGHGDAEALHARRIGQRCGQQAIGVHAACAGHGEHALQLGVQIQQLFAGIQHLLPAAADGPAGAASADTAHSSGPSAVPHPAAGGICRFPRHMPPGRSAPWRYSRSQASAPGPAGRRISAPGCSRCTDWASARRRIPP